MKHGQLPFTGEMAGKLYTYPNNFRAYKALVAAQYSGTDVTVVSEPPQFVLGETNKSDSFLQKFPLGKVPAYEAKNGDCVFESNAIAHYVANDQLRGSTAGDAAQILQWISFADSEILPAACSWVFPCLGIMQFNKQSTERAKEDLKAALNALNRRLATKTFLVGERVTLADIFVACNLLLPYQHVLEPAFRKSYPNTNRWFTTVVNQPQFKAVIGDFKLCEKMAQFDNKKYAELSGKGGKDKKEKPKAEKKETKKQPEPKVEDKAPEAPKPKKDPFADLPPTTFDFDEWKRTWSNNEIGVSLKYFWDKYDDTTCSCWFGKYKYPEEFALPFMASNLVGGMFQRLEKMHKNAFGSFVICNDKSITGIFVARGRGLPFKLDDDLNVDAGSFDWRILDPSKDEDKKLIEKYWTQDGEVKWEGVKDNNQEMMDCKAFK